MNILLNEIHKGLEDLGRGESRSQCVDSAISNLRAQVKHHESFPDNNDVPERGNLLLYPLVLLHTQSEEVSPELVSPD